jgi:hypothetical protein
MGERSSIKQKKTERDLSQDAMHLLSSTGVPRHSTSRFNATRRIPSLLYSYRMSRGYCYQYWIVPLMLSPLVDLLNLTQRLHFAFHSPMVEISRPSPCRTRHHHKMLPLANNLPSSCRTFYYRLRRLNWQSRVEPPRWEEDRPRWGDDGAAAWIWKAWLLLLF